MAAVSLFLSTCIGGPLRTTFKKAGREPLQTTKQHRAPKPSEDFSVPWKRETGEDTNQHSEAMIKSPVRARINVMFAKHDVGILAVQKEKTSKQSTIRKTQRKEVR